MHGFETQRLRARAIRSVDEELFCRLYSDAETMRHIGTPLTADAAAARFRCIVRARAGAPYLFTLSTVDGTATGLCGIVQICATRRRAEIGMMLLPSARARGFATEVLPALTAATFVAFPIDRVWVQYAPAHDAAERLVVRVGFKSCMDGEIAEKQSGNVIWAVDRPSSKPATFISTRGRNNDEHNRIS